MTLAEARAQSERLAALTPLERVGDVRDLTIPGPSGEIQLRVYHPLPDGALPIVVFFHGGGWVMGSLETADANCRTWANALGCVIVSVNYRHAPEHKFPAAAEDAYAATQWVSEHAGELGGDGKRLAVAGMSAGGNLAAVVSLMARDRGTPHIALQILGVPITNYDFGTASYRENADGYGLTRVAMEWFWQQYLNDPAEGMNPYASPLRAGDLSGLPPALVLTAEYDPLRDDGQQYADALRAAGVPTQAPCYERMIHGYLGPQALQDVVAAVRRTFPGE